MLFVTPFETGCNVTIVAAVPSAAVTVNLEHLTTMDASECVVRFSFHLVKMAVPPLNPALIAAEALFLLLRHLLNLPPAVITEGRFYGNPFKQLGCRFCIDFLPFAE